MDELEGMSRPLLSVCMAVRNEGRFIERALGDLLTQQIDYSLVEILIADGCSDDGTPEQISEVCARYPRRPVTVMRNPLRLQYAGVNRMVQRCRGRYILVVDGHSRFPDDFLAANLRALRSEEAGIAGGLWETRAANESAIARAIAACLSTTFGVGDASYRLGAESGAADSAPFPCIKREVFEDIGLFREEMLSNADTEFFSRARDAGFRICRDARIRSIYYARKDLGDLAKKAFRDGRWHASHTEAIRPRHLAPLLFVLVNFALLLGGVFEPALWMIWGALAVLYLGIASASAAGALPKAVHLRWYERPLMLLCYPVMHWVFGLGWLNGILSPDTRRARRQAAVSAPRLSTPLCGPLEPIPVDAGRRSDVASGAPYLVVQAAE